MSASERHPADTKLVKIFRGTIPRKAINEADVTAALVQWASTMQVQDPKLTAQLYHPDATFIGTIAEHVTNTSEGHAAYFRSFYRGKDNLQVQMDAVHIQILEEVAIASGAYSFTYDTFSARITVPARFTFAFARDGSDDLKIINHHSSANPKIQPTRSPLPARRLEK